MKLVQLRYVIRAGGYEVTDEWRRAESDILDAVARLTWPPDARGGTFTIHPESGKKRGQGNGVVPIKLGFLEALADSGWSINERRNPERFDAVRHLDDGYIVGAEWETGNISSTHRSLNRIVRAWQRGIARGGFLILPTKRLAQYLTDRVGNWEELESYLGVWEAHQWDRGALAIATVEQDAEDTAVPRIAKGTDGRALV